MIQSVLLESNTPTIKSEYMYGGDTIGLPAWCNGFFNGELCMGNCEMICLYGVIECKWRMVCIVWMHVKASKHNKWRNENELRR
jgi:hypothetical protein